MEYLFDRWNSLKEIIAARPLLLFLDYDGTLTPIARRPSAARVSRERIQLLEELSKMRGVTTAVMSGRNLTDIKNIIGINGIIYLGNHGLEIEGPKIKFTHPLSVRYTAALKKIKNELSEKLKEMRSVFVEDKGLTISM